MTLTDTERETLARAFAGSSRSPDHLAFLAAPAVEAIIAARLAPALALADWCAVKEADHAATLRGNYDAYAEGSRDVYDLVETRLRAALGVSAPTGDPT
jgi:hypothetical protein